MPTLLLASGSEVRAAMLRNAGIDIKVRKARIDEETIRGAMAAEGLSPRDMSDRLAELKALKVALRATDARVLGCDQVLEFGGECLSKPASPDEACSQTTLPLFDALLAEPDIRAGNYDIHWLEKWLAAQHD